MDQDLDCFVNGVIKIISANRTKNAPKAGRQVQFVFSSFKKDGYTEKEFIKLLNSAIKEERLALIGIHNSRHVVIHRILPVVLNLGNLSSYRWAIKTGSAEAIFRPTLYDPREGLPCEIIRKKIRYQTTGKKFYHVEPINNKHWILLNIQKPKSRKH